MAGIVVLDFAVQAGSALGAAATTATFTAYYGWTGSSLLGAGFAACALVVWATDRRLCRDRANLRSEKAGTHEVPETTQGTDQAVQVTGSSRTG
jgi:cyanate permease